MDHATLASFLRPLADTSRLELLDLLRVPRTLEEVRTSPWSLGSRGGRRGAPKTIASHLRKLVQTGLVRIERSEKEGRTVARYALNPQKLFALTEEMRRLALRPAETIGDRIDDVPSGPHLVLAHGAYEGKAFPLEPSAMQDDAWIIGRRAGLAVSLDYDPYVSAEHATIRQRDGRFVLADHRASRNGTRVNWSPLPKGDFHALRPADVIGVGRSLLVFVPAREDKPEVRDVARTA